MKLGHWVIMIQWSLKTLTFKWPFYVTQRTQMWKYSWRCCIIIIHHRKELEVSLLFWASACENFGSHEAFTIPKGDEWGCQPLTGNSFYFLRSMCTLDELMTGSRGIRSCWLTVEINSDEKGCWFIEGGIRDWLIVWLTVWLMDWLTDFTGSRTDCPLGKCVNLTSCFHSQLGKRTDYWRTHWEVHLSEHIFNRKHRITHHIWSRNRCRNTYCDRNSSSTSSVGISGS